MYVFLFRISGEQSYLESWPSLSPIEPRPPHVRADCSAISGNRQGLTKAVDITEDVFNVFYQFDKTKRPDESLRGGGGGPILASFPTPELALTRDQVFTRCTDVVINSTIAIECGPYFDSDIMVALNMCMEGWRALPLCKTPWELMVNFSAL